MKYRLFALLLLIGLLGCSSSDESKVYDTQANPAGYPKQALNLVDDLESGRLFGLDSITSAFGDLYTEHSELLDRPDWKDVISRLGVGFGRIADSLSQNGIATWTTAAEYYQLGSFARPDDSTLRAQAAQFGAWLAAEYYPGIDLKVITDTNPVTLNDLKDILRFFLTGEPAGREFYFKRLKPVLQSQTDHYDLTASVPADRALLAFAELADLDSSQSLTRFASPKIDLVAAWMSRADSISYSVEFYFLPREKVESQLNLMVRLEVADKSYLPLEIVPDYPTTSWPVNRLQLVARRFQYDQQITGGSIGLVESSPESMRYLMPENGDFHFWPLGHTELDLN